MSIFEGPLRSLVLYSPCIHDTSHKKSPLQRIWSFRPRRPQTSKLLCLRTASRKGLQQDYCIGSGSRNRARAEEVLESRERDGTSHGPRGALNPWGVCGANDTVVRAAALGPPPLTLCSNYSISPPKPKRSPTGIFPAVSFLNSSIPPRTASICERDVSCLRPRSSLCFTALSLLSLPHL